MPVGGGSQTLGLADSVSDDISIQANPSAPWFFDSSPLEHSEFDLSGTGTSGNSYSGTTLARDVGASNLSARFNGNVPSLFEIGYRGAAREASAADGRYDLFSTVIHEIGHILGVNFDPGDETWDPPGSTTKAAPQGQVPPGRLGLRECSLFCGRLRVRLQKRHLARSPGRWA